MSKWKMRVTNEFSSQLQMNVINNESNFVVNQHKIMWQN